MGIVHHAAFVVWLEEGRSQWLRDNGSSYAAFEQDGVSLAVSELDIRYIQAAVYDQLVTVKCWIDEIRSRKTVFGYEVIDTKTGNLLVKAHTKHICLNSENRVTKIPEKWRNFLNR